MTFEEDVLNAVQQTILKGIREVKFFDHWHNNRLVIPEDIVKEAFSTIDREKILNMVRASIEEQIAKTMTGQLLTEIATDTKRFMSDNETRKLVREKVFPVFLEVLKESKE